MSSAVAQGFEFGLADDDAFAGGEAVCLDDDGQGEPGQLVLDLIERAADGVGGGWDLVALHEGLREGFAGLQPRGCLGGSEGAEAVFVEHVDEAECEWQFGADYGQVGPAREGADAAAPGGLRCRRARSGPAVCRAGRGFVRCRRCRVRRRWRRCAGSARGRRRWRARVRRRR